MICLSPNHPRASYCILLIALRHTTRTSQDGHFDPELAWRQQVAELQTALDLTKAKALTPRCPPPPALSPLHCPVYHPRRSTPLVPAFRLLLTPSQLTSQSKQLADEAAARQEETSLLRRQLDVLRAGGAAAPGGADVVAKQAERISKLEKKVTEQGEAARQAGQVLLTLRNNLEAESKRSEEATREAAEARQRVAQLEAAVAAADQRANSVARESHHEVTKHWKTLDNAQKRVEELTEEVRRLTESKADRRAEVRKGGEKMIFVGSSPQTSISE